MLSDKQLKDHYFKKNKSYPTIYKLPKNSAKRAEVGDYVICVSDKMKLFIKGAIYKIVAVKESSYSYGIESFKLEGFYKFTSIKNFRGLNDKALRKEKINILNGAKTKSYIIPPFGRKLDIIENKNAVIAELVINKLATEKRKSQGDENDIFNWEDLINDIIRCDKHIHFYGVETKDFDDLENMTVREFTNYYLNKRKIDLENKK